MKVKKIVSGFLETNMFLFEAGEHLLIIDPADYAAAPEICRDVASVTILLTHEHFDHISGLNKIRDCCKFSCSVIAGKTCSERIQDAKTNMSVYADVLAEVAEKPLLEHITPFVCRSADITFKDYYAFYWQGHAVEMFAVPGHSAGSCCIMLDDMLFVGDTVLENSLMVKFPGSSKKLYRKVTVPLLEKLLSGNRVAGVYPGHGDVMPVYVALEIIRGV